MKRNLNWILCLFSFLCGFILNYLIYKSTKENAVTQASMINPSEIVLNQEYPDEDVDIHSLGDGSIPEFEDNFRISQKINYIKTDKYIILPSVLSDTVTQIPEEYHYWMDRKVEINYPQIYFEDDSGRREEINKILFEASIDANCDVVFEHYYVDLSVDYSIMQASSGFISICYFEEKYSAVRGNFTCRTVNIDIENGKMLDMCEFVRLDEVFRDKVKTDDLFNYVGYEKGTLKSYADIFKPENSFDEFVDEFFTDEKRHINDFYIRDGKLGIVLPATNSYIILEGDI